MIRRLLAASLLGLTGLLLLPTPAQAHPLGNFTTNQYAGLRITATGVDVDYVLDLAELPAYQARGEELDTDASGDLSAAETDAYAQRTCATVAAATAIAVDGRPSPVTGRPAELTFPAGAGGLTTLRLQCVLHADARIADESTIDYRGDAYADRIGWREITAVGDRYTLTGSTVPTASVSARLSAYPAGAPTLDVRTARLTVRPGGPAAAPFVAAGAAGSQARDVDRFTAWFTDLVGRPELTLGVGVLAFLVALVLGGAHAVAPGHGKTIMAAYLVGSRGRLSQALTVAGTVAATHTVGVLALGVLLATSLQLAPDAMYEWLRLASGVLVALVGAQLLRRAIRNLRARSQAQVAPSDATSFSLVQRTKSDLVLALGAGHRHGHGHSHDHGTAHVHAHGGKAHTHYVPAPDEPLRIRALLAMGFAGGL
jgi:nickel/cobalt exporter